jgi:hypothetical protein
MDWDVYFIDFKKYKIYLNAGNEFWVTISLQESFDK